MCAELENGGTGGDKVKIEYNTNSSGYCMTQIHAYAGDSVPVNQAGNPEPGQFPANVNLGSCLATYTVTLPLPQNCTTGNEFSNTVTKLAAHASMQLTSGGGGQTAWSNGTKIVDQGNWAMISELDISCRCIVPTAAPTKAPTKVPTKVRSLPEPCLLFVVVGRFFLSLLPFCLSLSFVL